SWLNTPATNFGLIIRDSVAADTAAISFASSEYATAANRPMLSIATGGAAAPPTTPPTTGPVALAKSAFFGASGNKDGFMAPVGQTGAVESQGDAAIQASTARSTFNVDGTGITVGVISDSYNSLGTAAADVASGDLPTNVQVLQDDVGQTDEGRAMLQIVHDV